MLKECVLLDGKIINIGSWDYKLESVEVEPAKIDEEGNVIEEAMYENQVTNPLPVGAEVVELEIAQNNDGGWYAVEYQQPSEPNEMELLKQRLEASEARNEQLAAESNANQLALMELHMMLLGVVSPDEG